MNKTPWIANPEIPKLYESGESSKELAKAFNCTVPTILKVVRSVGNVVNRQGRPSGMRKGTLKKVKIIKAMLNKGKSFSEIAEHFNCTVPAISYLHKRYVNCK